MEDSVEVGRQSVEGRLGLRNLVAKCQFGPTMYHLLLWRYRCLEISSRWAQSPKLGGRLVAVYPHLQ